MTTDRISITQTRTQKHPRNFSLYAIHRLAGGADDEEFTAPLPFDIAEGVRIEDISSLVRAETFDLFKDKDRHRCGPAIASRETCARAPLRAEGLS